MYMYICDIVLILITSTYMYIHAVYHLGMRPIFLRDPPPPQHTHTLLSLSTGPHLIFREGRGGRGEGEGEGVWA